MNLVPEINESLAYLNNEPITAATMTALAAGYADFSEVRAAAPAALRIGFGEQPQLGRAVRAVLTMTAHAAGGASDGKKARMALYLEIVTAVQGFGGGHNKGIWTPKIGEAVFEFSASPVGLPAARKTDDATPTWWADGVAFASTGVLEALVGQAAAPLSASALVGNGLAVPDIGCAQGLIVVPALESADSAGDGPAKVDVMAMRWR